MFALVICGLLTLALVPATTEATKKGSGQCPRRKHDMFFLVDGSMRIGTREFRDMRKFLKKFVSRLRVGLGKTHVGLLIVNNQANTRIEISLGQHESSKALSQAVGRIKQHRRRHSDLAYALELVQNKVFTDKGGDRPGVHDVLIIFTSRIDATQLENVLRRAEVLKSRNVEIITVAFQKTKISWNFKDELTALASIPRNVLTLQSSHLRKLRRTLNRRICISRRTLHPTKGCISNNRDVFFVLDGSGSISMSHFLRMKQFLTELIERLDVGPQGTHVGLLQFSHKLKTKIEFRLGQYQTFKEIKRAIHEVSYQEGGTETGDALETVNREVFPHNDFYRSNATDVVVILTDGEARDRTKALLEAGKLRRKGVQIIAIGMGEENTVATFRRDLRLMASTSSNVFTSGFKNLPYLVKALTSGICYGRRRKATTCAHEKRDVLLLVDGSASVGYRNMNKVKDFLKKLVLELNIGKRRNHVGLVQFSEAEKTRSYFSLNQYYDAQKIERAIDEMEYHAGVSTMIGYALAMANHKIFDGQRGDRPRVDDVVILLADGGAHDKTEALMNSKKLKQRGARILTVLVPNSESYKQDEELLRNLASTANDFYTSNFENLKHIAADLVKVVCSGELGTKVL